MPNRRVAPELEGGTASNPPCLNLPLCLPANVLPRARRPAAISRVHKTDTPSNPFPYVCLGNVLKAIGDLGGAVAAYGEATRLEPNDATVHSNGGITLYVMVGKNLRHSDGVVATNFQSRFPITIANGE